MTKAFSRVPREKSETPKIILAIGLFLFITYFVAALSFAPGIMKVSEVLNSVFDCQQAKTKELPQELTIEGQDCPSVTEKVVNLESMNFDSAPSLRGTLRVWPAGEIGSALVNTGVAQRPLMLRFDSLRETSWQIPAKRFVGSKSFAVPLANASAISRYPFDEYRGTWTSVLSDFQTSKPLAATLTVPIKPIYGWEIAVAQKELLNDIDVGKVVNLNGKSAIEWNAQRTSSVKLSVLLLIAVMIVGTASAIILTKSIFSRRRPPTLNALGWLATSLFAVLEIRNRFPGNPPLGISLDLFVTYPVTLVLLCLILANTNFWIKRDDWDMKNRPKEHADF